MKQIDNHRYIKVKDTIIGTKVTLFYRVPYVNCFGRRKFKFVEVAYTYSLTHKSYNELFRYLEWEAKERAKERSKKKRTKKMSNEDRIAHEYREFLMQQNNE